MTSEERVTAALSFCAPDRTPRYLGFSDAFITAWKRYRSAESADDPLDHFGSDMVTIAADERTWPTKAREISRTATEVVKRTGWGSLVREKTHASFSELLEPAITERIDPDKLRFDSPLDDDRYLAAGRHVTQFRGSKYVICKTGGPFIRATFMRGTENFLVDIAEDPEWARAFIERLTDHLIAIGTESIRRFGLQSTGIIVHDDICSLRGPMISPHTYERVIYPAMARMVSAYKAAGAGRYIHHCDGNISALLDYWVDAGVDAVNPCEPRAGLAPEDILARYGRKLAVIGGLDNTGILPRGDPTEVIAHARRLAELAQGGGLVACAGISEDVSIDTMELVRRELDAESVRNP